MVLQNPGGRMWYYRILVAGVGTTVKPVQETTCSKCPVPKSYLMIRNLCNLIINDNEYYHIRIILPLLKDL